MIVVIQDKVPLQEKLDQILEWIDLPIETRPQFIMGLSILSLSMVQLLTLYNSSIRAISRSSWPPCRTCVCACQREQSPLSLDSSCGLRLIAYSENACLCGHICEGSSARGRGAQPDAHRRYRFRQRSRNDRYQPSGADLHGRYSR